MQAQRDIDEVPTCPICRTVTGSSRYTVSVRQEHKEMSYCEGVVEFTDGKSCGKLPVSRCKFAQQVSLFFNGPVTITKRSDAGVMFCSFERVGTPEFDACLAYYCLDYNAGDREILRVSAMVEKCATLIIHKGWRLSSPMLFYLLNRQLRRGDSV